MLFHYQKLHLAMINEFNNLELQNTGSPPITRFSNNMVF